MSDPAQTSREYVVAADQQAAFLEDSSDGSSGSATEPGPGRQPRGHVTRP